MTTRGKDDTSPPAPASSTPGGEDSLDRGKKLPDMAPPDKDAPKPRPTEKTEKRSAKDTTGERTAFRTQDGVHYLCIELDGTLNATRTEAGPWEHFDVLPHPDHDDIVYLKSAHNKLLSAYSLEYCAQKGLPPHTVMATADHPDIWEQWRVSFDDMNVRLQSVAWDKWLSPQNVPPNPNGGGGEVLCNGPEPAGWETLTPTNMAAFGLVAMPPISMPGPGESLPRLSVSSDRRWLQNVHGQFDYRDKSAFTLLGRMVAGQTEHVKDYLRWARARRFNVLRVFICNTIGGYPSGPDQANFWAACDELIRLFTAHGIYMRACMIAATEPFGGVWEGHGVDIWEGEVQTKGEQFCVDFAQRYRDNGTIIGELFNEPCNIGLRHSQDDVIALGYRVKQVAPGMLLMGGHYEDSTMCAAPFDIVTLHFARYMEVQGSAWIKRSSEYPPCQAHSQKVRMPALSGEPANAGQNRKDGHNQDVFGDPSVSFAAAAMSRAHQYLACFHSDDGLYTDLPQQITEDHIAAWHKALDAFPMMNGGLWSGHHGLHAGDYWKDVWPPTDNTDEVEQHIRDGKGPWRAYGCGGMSVCFMEPKGWNWQSALEAPAERVAFDDRGDFQAGVYRRL